MKQQPMGYFFWHRNPLICQLKRYTHIKAVVFIGIDRHFFIASLLTQNIVAAIAGNAKHVWTEFFRRVNLHEVDV